MFLPATAAVLAACLLSMMLTLLMRRLAPHVGLTDQPDGHRKLHEQPIPLGGGVAVFLATAVVLAVVLVVPNPFGLDIHYDWLRALGFTVGCAGVLGLGLIDDRFGLRGRYKLVGQIAAAGGLVGITGLVIYKLGIFGFEIELGWFSVPFTLFWLVGAINAINLLDGIDGLAATLGIVICTTLGVLAFLTGNPHVALVALVFAGSLLGFLRYNFPPATIYLGDAGSMLIGLLVGALSIRAGLKGAGTVLLAAPLAALAIPILDSAAAIVRRRLTGRSVYATDRGHLHHRMLDALGSNRKVLAVVVLGSAITSGGALACAAMKSDLVAVIAAVGLAGIFVATNLFGRGELALVAGRLRRVARALAGPMSPRSSGPVQITVRLQGREQWDRLWENLTGTADRMNLTRMHLDVSLPSAHESYNATWDRRGPAAAEDCWHTDLPLCVAGRAVGRLTLTGTVGGATTAEYLEQICALMAPLEARLCALAGHALTAAAPAGSPARAAAEPNGEAWKLHTDDAPVEWRPVPVTGNGNGNGNGHGNGHAPHATPSPDPKRPR